jgi:hypothetical protein
MSDISLIPFSCSTALCPMDDSGEKATEVERGGDDML